MMDEADLVMKKFACPECGEREVDKLVFLNDESDLVQCQTCGIYYNPFTGEVTVFHPMEEIKETSYRDHGVFVHFTER